MHSSNSEIKMCFILAAAGSGKRMNLNKEKQFLIFDDEPLFYHSLKVAEASDLIGEIIISTNQENISYVEDFCKEKKLKKIKKVCSGGKERQESVYNALKYISEDIKVVCVHDAARPKLYEEYFKTCLHSILKEKFDGAIIGTFARDTVKIIDENNIIKSSPDRKFIVNANTPQVFLKEKLISAHESARKNNFFGTDDAQLLENKNYKIKFIEGYNDNIKITFKEDLDLLNYLGRKK